MAKEISLKEAWKEPDLSGVKIKSKKVDYSKTRAKIKRSMMEEETKRAMGKLKEDVDAELEKIKPTERDEMIDKNNELGKELLERERIKKELKLFRRK